VITASYVLHNKTLRRTSRSRATGNKTGELTNAANATGGSRNAADMSNNTAAINGCSYAAVLVYKYRSKNDVIVKRRSQARMIYRAMETQVSASLNAIVKQRSKHTASTAATVSAFTAWYACMV